VIRVAGILEEVSTEDTPGLPHSDSGFVLILRRPSDITLVSRAPFWTTELLARLALAGLILLLVSLAWVRSLRVRVDQRTRQLARETQQRRHEEVEFAAVLSERKRLAAELHDTLEQSLTGVSLQLQAADLARAAGAEPQTHLELANRLLERSREEIRRSVWDLRSETLDSRDLHAAVLSLARAGAGSGGPAVTVEVQGSPEPLPDLIANHLLRVVQEAVRNADKNGRATAIRIALRYLADAVEVEVTDNGCGFDPATAPGTDSGHFGLQGIRERAARLGGQAVIRSAPGQGTVISARVPWSPRVTRAGSSASA
jgi:signal transduction histidine kinase